MSTERTEKYRHKSITTDIYCSDAQYLAEFICVRIAKKRGENLPSKFWSDTGWKLAYQKHILAANNLLKVYEFEAIINALKSRSYQWVTYLLTKQLAEQIAIEQETINKYNAKMNALVQKEKEKSEEANTNIEEAVVAKPFANNKKNKLSNLD